ncbi:MAG: hypothetical protein AABW90_00185 [Nanoarchaeota archaeon]
MQIAIGRDSHVSVYLAETINHNTETDANILVKMGRDCEILKKLASIHRGYQVNTLFTENIYDFRAVEKYCQKYDISIDVGFNGANSITDKFLYVFDYSKKNLDKRNFFQLTNSDEVNNLKELYEKANFLVNLV